jgi:UDP:flavonoid glycosyltransferase YjiC (YdhE family)
MITESQAPRILFVGESVSLAHVGRPVVLARWARDAGYDVHFACGNAFADVAAEEGFSQHRLETIDPRTFYVRLGAGKFFYTTDELDAYVPAELKLIEEVKPDLVVGDFRLTLDISTRLSGVPLLSLNNAHWSPAAACRFPPPNAGIFKILPSGLRDSLFSMLRPIAFKTFARPLDVVRRKYGLPSLHDFRQHYTAGKFCAYMDLPELSSIDAMPEGHFFLGPVVWEPQDAAHSFSQGSCSARPLAYVTLGSTGEARLLPAVLTSLLSHGCDIALSGVLPNQLQELNRSIPGLRDRCFGAPLIRPRDVLDRAVVTVCHGGSGTVYQSLAAGVPLLCLPGNPDQCLVSSAVTEAGAGLTIEVRSATPTRLEQAFRKLFSNGRFEASARRLATAILRHNTQQHWLDFLERTLTALPEKKSHAELELVK